MANKKYTVDEFAEIIKSKRPAYADRDNKVLVDAYIKKFPVYADRVDTTPVQDQDPGKLGELIGFAKDKLSQVGDISYTGLGGGEPRTIKERLSTGVKEGTKSAFLAASMTLPGAAQATTAAIPIVGKIIAPIVGSAVYGATEYAKSKTLEKLEGVPDEESQALAEGVTSALLSIGLQTGFKVVGSTFGLASNFLMTKVPKPWLTWASQNVDKLTTKQPSVAKVARTMSRMLESYAKDTKHEYQKGMAALNAGPATKVDVSHTGELIKNLHKTERMNLNKIRSTIRAGVDEGGYGLSNSAIERFINGGKLSLSEAERINRALGIAQKSKINPIGEGSLSKWITDIKQSLLMGQRLPNGVSVGGIEGVAPGLAKVNDNYSTSLYNYNLLRKDWGVKSGFKAPGKIHAPKSANEGQTRAIGREIVGEKGNVAEQANNLLEFEKYYPKATGLTKRLVDSTGYELFQNLKDPSISSALAAGGASGALVPGGQLAGVTAAIGASEPAVIGGGLRIANAFNSLRGSLPYVAPGIIGKLR